ncbi:MAG: glycosyltransferase family 2 protein [Candidatus Dormibacteraceae bacterium]
MSVVIPYFRGERHLAATVDGVLHQTLVDWELVLVDDGGSPDAAGVLGSRLREPRLRVLRQPNRGVAAARNAGFARASPDSRYLLFLDQDDLLEPEMLATLASYLDDHADVGMVSCDRTLIDAEGNLLPAELAPIVRFVPKGGGRGVGEIPPDSPDTPFVSIFSHCRISPALSLLRRSIYEAAGGWDEALGQLREDLDLWRRVALLAAVHFLPRKLVRRRVHEGEVSLSLSSAAMRRAARRLDEKWAHLEWLPERHHRQVAEAVVFRERALLPMLWRRWAREALRRGHLARAANCYRHAVRHRIG